MAFAELHNWNTEIGGLEYGNEYDEIGGGTPPGRQPDTGRTAGYSGISGVPEVRQRSEGMRNSGGQNEGISSAELGARLSGEAWRTAGTEIVQAEGYESGDWQTRGIRVIKDPTY